MSDTTFAIGKGLERAAKRCAESMEASEKTRAFGYGGATYLLSKGEVANTATHEYIGTVQNGTTYTLYRIKGQST